MSTLSLPFSPNFVLLLIPINEQNNHWMCIIADCVKHTILPLNSCGPLAPWWEEEGVERRCLVGHDCSVVMTVWALHSVTVSRE